MIKENETISKVLLSVEQYKNIDQFRSAILRNDYCEGKNNFSRLLLWKTCIITETLNFHEWDSKLYSCRIIYHRLKLEPDMIVPWDTLDTDDVFYCKNRQSGQNNSGNTLRREANVKADPLGTTGNVVDNEADGELLSSIILDVKRIFPGDPHFNGTDDACLKRKRQLIRLLFIWSKCNPYVGYKQGIHEILGLIFLNLWKESINIPNTNTFSREEKAILSLYDMKYLEHDLFTIFNRFVVSSGIISQFYSTEDELMNSITVFNMYLMKVDQLIHYNLITKLRLESQLWIIRYFRLLLLRELGNDLTAPSTLWDKLAAIDTHTGSSPIPDVITFLIIVMLIHVQSDLITCDFSEALSLLLHYPIARKLAGDPNFIDTVFAEAYKLSSVKKDDMRLYEVGRKLNKKYNRSMRPATGQRASTDLSRSLSLTPTLSPQGESLSEASGSRGDQRAEKMAFEKTRLELRLKKRAQSIIK